MSSLQQTQALSAAISASFGKHDGKILPSPASQDTPVPSCATRAHFESAKSVAELTKGYNVRNMSPREMSAMSYDLYESGAISFQDHALLSFQPELGAESSDITNQADTPKDFIAHWEQQLRLHKQHGETAFAQHDQRILNILGNIEAISSQDTL